MVLITQFWPTAPIGPFSEIKSHFGEGAIQLPAGQSVVVVHEEHIYKMVVNLYLLDSYERRICHNYTKLNDLDCISLPEVINRSETCMILKVKNDFLKFKRLIYPLRREAAKECLKEFLLKIYCALDKLHKCGFGHLDVRLENICFRYDDSANDYKVVLIDLDVLQEIEQPSYGLASESRMSHQPPGSTLSNNSYLDWSQLGLMTAFIASHPLVVKHEDYHDPNFKYLIEQDLFIETLMKKGKTWSRVKHFHHNICCMWSTLTSFFIYNGDISLENHWYGCWDLGQIVACFGGHHIHTYLAIRELVF